MQELDKGHAFGPFSERQLHDRFGYFRWRPMLRFVSWLPKPRVCDDARQSLHNACSSSAETICCIAADFPLRLARAFAAAHGGRMPAVLFSVDDIEAAYRKIPVRFPEYTVIAAVDPKSLEVCYFFLPGHNFGVFSAVLNFNAVPEMVTHVLRTFLAVPEGHYFDDAGRMDLAHLASSSQSTASQLYAMLGWALKPSKSLSPAAANPYLGLVCDLTRAASHNVALLSAKESSRLKALAMARAHLELGAMSPAAAGKLYGLARFALLAPFSRLGLAMLQPLQRRQHMPAAGLSRPVELGTPLRAALRALTCYLRDIPRVEVPIVPDARAPVIVFTDATGAPHYGIAVVVYVPETGTVHFARGAVPDHLLDVMRSIAPKSEFVNQAELVAAAAAYTTFPHLLAGRAVYHFIDSSSSAHGVFRGYSSKLDSAYIIHALHLAAADIKARIWIMYVPSECNLADKPSRSHDPDSLSLMRNMSATEAPIVPPAIHETWQQGPSYLS